MMEEMLFESLPNVDWVKNRYVGVPINSSHDPDAHNLNSDDIVDHLAKADPTSYKDHLGWIADQYDNGNIRLEHSLDVRNSLNDFERYKHLIKKDEQRSASIGMPINNGKTGIYPIPMDDIHHYDDLDHLNRVLDNYRNVSIPTTDIGVDRGEIINAKNGGYWNKIHANIATNKVLDHVKKHGDFWGAHKEFLDYLGSFDSVKDEYKKALSNHLSQRLLSGHQFMSEIYRAKDGVDGYWNDKIHNKDAADGLSKRLRLGTINDQDIRLAKRFNYWDQNRHTNDMSIGLLRKMQGPPKNKLKKAGIGIASGIFKVAKAYVKFAGKH